MSLYVYVDDQNVPFGQAVLLEDAIPCNRGFVIHQNGSGILTPLGIVNNPCSRFTRYLVRFKGNIAVPTGGTVGEISLAITANGEPVAYSISSVTPAAVENFFSVSGFAVIDVIRGGSPSVALRNVSATEGAITTRNVAVSVDRIA